nr:MAG TPA: hypothetical protein [Caudoviricetes sp.]
MLLLRHVCLLDLIRIQIHNHRLAIYFLRKNDYLKFDLE